MAETPPSVHRREGAEYRGQACGSHGLSTQQGECRRSLSFTRPRVALLGKAVSDTIEGVCRCPSRQNLGRPVTSFDMMTKFQEILGLNVSE